MQNLEDNNKHDNQVSTTTKNSNSDYQTTHLNLAYQMHLQGSPQSSFLYSVPAQTRPVEVTVWVISDAVCPWCFVAKRKLEKAMTLFPNAVFTIEWVPFFLAEPDSLAIFSNPLESPTSSSQSTPTTSPTISPSPTPSSSSLSTPSSSPSSSFGQLPETVSERLRLKYGDERGRQMILALQKAGEAVGITWSDHRIPVNTVLSHGLVKFAGHFHKQNEVMDTIFSNYFEKALDISNVEVLVKIAKEVNLDENEARLYLSNPELPSIIRLEAEEARHRYKVCGVPTFMISRGDKKSYKLRFSGAQPVEVFAAAFKRILELQ